MSRPAACIRVIGCGEAFDGIGLGNTSVLLQSARDFGVPAVLVDCGYQIPERLWRGAHHMDLDALCLTHLHADHALGVVPLLARFWEERRQRPLVILGPAGTEAWVEKAMQLGYPGLLKRLAFPLNFEVLEPGQVTELGAIRIRVARTEHSVLNLTVRIELPGGRFFSVSGDGQVTPASLALTAGGELHFQETFARVPGISNHADLQTLVAAWSIEQAPKRILLTHMARGERSELLSQVRDLARADEKWGVAHPNQVFLLDFDPGPHIGAC
jgi:ribonuclease Z